MKPERRRARRDAIISYTFALLLCCALLLDGPPVEPVALLVMLANAFLGYLCEREARRA